jgi:hypothetical protein
MSASAYAIAIAIAAAGGASAVYLQRRWPHRPLATWLVSITWAVLLVVAFRLVMGRPAPYFWSEAEASAEPWERLPFSLAVVSLIWPALRIVARRSAALELWLALAAVSLPLASALPVGESYLDVLPGNATWSIAALLAIGANWLASERLAATGAERWSLWVLVAQMLTVAALSMTCYARLADWCFMLGLGFAVLALCRLSVTSGEWTSTLSLPALALSCSLLTHIRIYSGDLLPPWLLSLPMLLPALVGGIDRWLAGKCQPGYRIAIAAAAAALIALGVITFAVATGEAEG